MHPIRHLVTWIDILKFWLLCCSVDLRTLVEQNKPNFIPPTSRMTNYVVLRFGDVKSEPNVSSSSLLDSFAICWLVRIIIDALHVISIEQNFSVQSIWWFCFVDIKFIHVFVQKNNRDFSSRFWELDSSVMINVLHVTANWCEEYWKWIIWM